MSEGFDQCPHCEREERKHKVAFHLGFLRCGTCGAMRVRFEWVYLCEKCGEETDKLHGYMVPHLCETCFDATVAEQEAKRYVCGTCGKARIACPH